MQCGWTVLGVGHSRQWGELLEEDAKVCPLWSVGVLASFVCSTDQINWSASFRRKAFRVWWLVGRVVGL